MKRIAAVLSLLSISCWGFLPYASNKITQHSLGKPDPSRGYVYTRNVRGATMYVTGKQMVLYYGLVAGGILFGAAGAELLRRSTNQSPLN